MFAVIGSLISSIAGGVLSPILKYFTSTAQIGAQEFATLTMAQQTEYIAYVNTIAAINQTKVAANSWWGAHVMVYLFGLPAALHWNAVFLDSTFRFGWQVPALPTAYAGAELNIALSFFILAPALPVITSISAALGRK